MYIGFTGQLMRIRNPSWTACSRILSLAMWRCFPIGKSWWLCQSKLTKQAWLSTRTRPVMTSWSLEFWSSATSLIIPVHALVSQEIIGSRGRTTTYHLVSDSGPVMRTAGYRSSLQRDWGYLILADMKTYGTLALCSQENWRFKVITHCGVEKHMKSEADRLFAMFELSRSCARGRVTHRASVLIWSHECMCII